MSGKGKQILDHRMDFVQNEFIIYRSVSLTESSEPDKKLYKQIDGQIKLLADALEKNIFIAFIYDLLTLPELTNYNSLCLSFYTLKKIEELVSESHTPKKAGMETAEKLKNSIHKHMMGSIMKSYLEDVLECWILFKQETEKKPIRQVKTYIEENYNQDVNLNSLSRLVYLNPIYLSSMFKQETGVSITDYIIEVRLKKAKELLADTPMFIGEIASAVGYKDTRYFSKLFLKHVGIKPTEYRKYHS
jgi:two-component system response regulator YesN